LGEDEVEIEDLSFTPCDCNAAHPSWRIDASSADVTLGESVFLAWPVVRVYGVPVFAFPALDLPLTDRRSGLLMPKPGTSSNNGFSIEQPLFLTLGRSYDLTLTPGYYFGATEDTPGDVIGVRGPTLVTDFRFVPNKTHRGEVALSLIEDLKPPRFPDIRKASGPGHAGLRGSLSGQDTAELGGDLYTRTDLSLASDGAYVTDFTNDLLERQTKYLRSDATLFERAPDRYLGIAALYRQDTRWDFDLFEQRRTLSGLFAPRTLQALPDALASFPRRRIFGDLQASFDLRFTRLSPLVGRFGDEGPLGVYFLVDGDSPENHGAGDRNFQPGEREARDRLDLHPSLSATWTAGHFLAITPTLALRQDLYLGELTGTSAQRGHVYADLLFQSRLSKRFGGPLGLTHEIVSSLQLRYAPRGWGKALGHAVGVLGDALRPYDELDLAMPDEGIGQAVVQISQRLVLREGLATRELLRLDLGQELDLKAGEGRDAYGRLGLQLAHFTFEGVARFDGVGKRFSELSASGALTLAPGARVFAAYDDIRFGGSARERRGVDTLVGTAYEYNEFTSKRAQFLSAGGQVRVGAGLSFNYLARVQPNATMPLLQQVLGLTWSPACDCWSLGFQVSAARRGNDPFGNLAFSGGLTISHFGSIGAGG
jgi:LPS-assembly protein